MLTATCMLEEMFCFSPILQSTPYTFPVHEVEIACDKFLTTKTFYLDSELNAVQEIIQWCSSFFNLLFFSFVGI